MFKRLLARLKGYKTIVFNTVVGSAAGIGIFLEEIKELDLTPWFGAYAAKIVVVIAVAGLLLRLYTDGPAAIRKRRDEPVGYELLDDEYEDDYGSERDNARARARRRESRRLAG